MEERSSSGAEQGRRPVRAGRKLLGFDQATADGVDEILAKLNKLGEVINALPPAPRPTPPPLPLTTRPPSPTASLPQRREAAAGLSMT